MLGSKCGQVFDTTRMASVGHAMIALVPGPIRRSASRAEIQERETPSIPQKRGVACIRSCNKRHRWNDDSRRPARIRVP